MGEQSSEDLTWLLEPVGADRVMIHVRIGDDVELDDDQRRALEELVQAFHQREVEGYSARTGCNPLGCDRFVACAVDTCSGYSCMIETFGFFRGLSRG